MIDASVELRVRFAETDAMGVVYHANYLAWCECARLKLVESIGLDYVKMSTEGTHLPVVEAHLNYKRPARFGDVVKVRAILKERPTAKIKIEYEITKGSTLLAVGHTVHVFINNEGFPIKPPKDVSQIFNKAFANL